MEAPPSAVQALIKAHRPVFRSLSDKVAFACHAVATANGLRLVATANAADEQDLSNTSAPEVEADGWDARQGEYTFLYVWQPAVGAAGVPQTLLIKCVTIADALCVTLLAGGGSQAPVTVELPLASTAVPSGSAVSGGAAAVAALSPSEYGDLASLVASLGAAMRSQLGIGGAAAASAGRAGAPSPSAATSKSACGMADEAANQDAGGASRLQEPPRGNRPSGRNPLLADDHDQDWRPPGGLPDPLMVGPPRRGGGGGFDGGGVPAGPFGPAGGGGMHVGPGDPLFAGRVRHPVGFGPGGVPAMPGQRWDPIAPEGLQGWSPDDFVRGGGGGTGQGPPLHPDLAQPGPGRGTDWDNMFG
uniref:PI31 proteasome regulator N-terminal domain-containing protein n=1 Tax=Chlamydomonas euryale TaxID=1486919 RepID=A0A7R9Z1J1_9CHLO|mmetsp:Transcript_40784/g.121723  ORF Transcript_40784/g.121723 Transcript_40784/m.121723 type:complete len:359 (+) Transcript_40784:529-1605(+)